MNNSNRVVSIHPYFKIRPGQTDAVKNLLPAFVQKTEKETKNLYYGFTLSGETLFCREAYVGAEGLLEHLENVGPELEKMLKLAEVLRVEVHGPSADLEKLQGPLAGLKPIWFTSLVAVSRG